MKVEVLIDGKWDQHWTFDSYVNERFRCISDRSTSFDHTIYREFEHIRLAHGVFISDFSTSKAIYDNPWHDVHVICPHCKNCESHPADEQRHHLQHFHVLEWLLDTPEFEISLMQCGSCNKIFCTIWDDKNTKPYIPEE